MDLEERLRAYAISRGDLVSLHDAELIVNRTLASGARRSPWPRRGLNAAAAVALSLLFLVAGVVVGMQLHGLRISGARPSPGPLPPVPNEIVDIDDLGSPDVTPFRLRDSTVLAPRLRWILAPGTGLIIDPGRSCDLTWIHIVDPASPRHDTRSPVSLPGCYQSPTIVPNSTVVLLDRQAIANGNTQELGTIAYDWEAGRVIKTYPNIRLGFNGGLVSPNGRLLYSIDAYSPNASMDIVDLTTGANVAHIDLLVFGFNGGGIRLSPDARTLYLNEGIRLRLFDARTGKAGAVLDFKDAHRSPTAVLPGWLSSWLPVDADAKESIETGHGIAVDPQGRWVAALGIDDSPDFEGIWVFDAAGSGRLVRHIETSSAGAHFRGLAFSLDGSVVYALQVEAQRGLIDVIDPQTGRMRALPSSRFSDAGGIAGVDAAA